MPAHAQQDEVGFEVTPFERAWMDHAENSPACSNRGELTTTPAFLATEPDFAADMAKMASDSKTREWWTHTDPLQEPMPARAEGEWWLTIPEVFHTD
jgi:L-rhamnose mutarotase